MAPFGASEKGSSTTTNSCHPGRSEAERRDPGATAMRRPLGPGSASPPGMTRVCWAPMGIEGAQSPFSREQTPTRSTICKKLDRAHQTRRNRPHNQSHLTAREGRPAGDQRRLSGVIERGHRSGQGPGGRFKERAGDVNPPIGGKPRPPPVRRFAPGSSGIGVAAAQGWVRREAGQNPGGAKG
jgi:hypothetical protein